MASFRDAKHAMPAHADMESARVSEFFSLPRELRDYVYDYLLNGRVYVRKYAEDIGVQVWNAPHLRRLLVSRQFRQELLERCKHVTFLRLDEWPLVSTRQISIPMDLNLSHLEIYLVMPRIAGFGSGFAEGYSKFFGQVSIEEIYDQVIAPVSARRLPFELNFYVDPSLLFEKTVLYIFENPQVLLPEAVGKLQSAVKIWERDDPRYNKGKSIHRPAKLLKGWSRDTGELREIGEKTVEGAK